MKILSVGNFGTGWDGSICDEEHIAKALEELGHEVIRWQRDDTNLNYGGTVKWFDEGEPDFTLIAQWDGYDNIKTKDYDSSFIKELPKPLVYWAFDYQADGQEWHQKLIEQSDLYLSKRIADSKYPNWQWLSQDFAPWFMGRHDEKPERDIDVLFTGSYLPWATERNETLKAINDTFNLEIHSVNEWPTEFKNVQGPVMDKDYTALIARANINISIDHTLEAGYWSDRTAQIMACGGFTMMRYISMAESRFQDKVVWFYSIEDCLKKIKHYLEDYTARKVIGSMGYSYAQENLMVKNRVKDLLTIVQSIL